MNFVRYLRDCQRFKRIGIETDLQFALRTGDLHPCLPESFDRHHLYHNAWAVRILTRLRPSLHIGSDLRFATLVSACIPVRHYDYRPPSLQLENMTSQFADILALFFQSRRVQSVSCINVSEQKGISYG